MGIFLDEVQYLSPEELAAPHRCLPRGRATQPSVVLCRALDCRRSPPLPAMQNHMPSAFSPIPKWASSTRYRPARRLVHPAKNEGVDFEDEAIEEILDVTERYPYFIQEWGFHVWNSAPESPIQRTHVQEATPGIIAHLDANFFRVRFDRLTQLQQKYLRAMAELGQVRTKPATSPPRSVSRPQPSRRCASS